MLTVLVIFVGGLGNEIKSRARVLLRQAERHRRCRGVRAHLRVLVSIQPEGSREADRRRSPVPYRKGDMAYEPPRYCWCDPKRKAPRWISWSPQNPSRRYYSCADAMVSLHSTLLCSIFLLPSLISSHFLFAA